MLNGYHNNTNTMTTIPDQLKILSDSPEIYKQSQKTGEKFDLHINQVGELDAEIRDILSGESKSTDFVSHIMERLEIDNNLANQIAVDVNSEIFTAIKEQLQSRESGIEPSAQNASTPQQFRNEQAVIDLEKIGGFTIEKTPEIKADAPTESQPVILNNIENPQPATHTIYKPIDPLVDNLLNTPITIPPEKAPIKPAVTTAQPQTTKIPPQPLPPKKAGPDPYREPVQ